VILLTMGFVCEHDWLSGSCLCELIAM